MSTSPRHAYGPVFPCVNGSLSSEYTLCVFLAWTLAERRGEDDKLDMTISCCVTPPSTTTSFSVDLP